MLPNLVAWCDSNNEKPYRINLYTVLLTMIISLPPFGSFMMWSLEGKDPEVFFLEMMRYFTDKLTDFWAQLAILNAGLNLNFSVAAIVYRNRRKIVELIKKSSSINFNSTKSLRISLQGKLLWRYSNGLVLVSFAVYPMT